MLSYDGQVSSGSVRRYVGNEKLTYRKGRLGVRESTLGGVLAVLGEGLNVVADSDAAVESHDLVDGVGLFPDGLEEGRGQVRSRKADEAAADVGQLADLRREVVHEADEALGPDGLDQRDDVVKQLERGRLLGAVVEEEVGALGLGNSGDGSVGKDKLIALDSVTGQAILAGLPRVSTTEREATNARAGHSSSDNVLAGTVQGLVHVGPDVTEANFSDALVGRQLHLVESLERDVYALGAGEAGVRRVAARLDGKGGLGGANNLQRNRHIFSRARGENTRRLLIGGPEPMGDG